MTHSREDRDLEVWTAQRIPRGTSPGRTASLVVAGLGLAALLCAPALLETATAQPYGPVRTMLVDATERLDAVSQATRLDRPWRALNDLVHPSPSDPGLASPAPEPPTPPPGPLPDPPPATPSPTPDTTPSTGDRDQPTERRPTRSDPLRVWIAGDSMWERPGPELVDRLGATEVVATTLDFRYSTGLTRPDFFDWHGHAHRELPRLDPELVLFFVGPNDSQPLARDGVIHQPGSAGFLEAYRARVRTLMITLADDGREVLWIGLPVMRSARFDARMRELDDIYREVAATTEGVTYVSTRELFSDAAGAYTDHLPDHDGVPRLLRNTDGIHLSQHGARRLADHLFSQLADRWPLTSADHAGS